MKKRDYNVSRRNFLLKSSYAGVGLGLRSFLLGLPVHFLTQRAMAAANSTFLVYAYSDQGEPLNANCPGSYVNGVLHPSAWSTPVDVILGGQVVKGAPPWASLPQDLRDRLNFIHYDTRTNSHAEAASVLRVHGDLRAETGNSQEMLPSAVSQMLESSLGTLNRTPAVLSNIGPTVTFNSTPVPATSASSIKQLFSGNQSSNAADMARFRDQAIDNIYSELKSNGTAAQKKFLDNHANSSRQSRDLANEFLATLDGLGTTGQGDPMIGAAALIAAKVSPVVVVKLNFGGDNHGLNPQSHSKEVDYNTAAIQAIGTLWERLKALGLSEQVTFCSQDVFGRTLSTLQQGWRNHNGAHTVSAVFGPNIKPGVTGGVDLSAGLGNGRSGPINSVNGSMLNADISQAETLPSVAKTIMKACGADEVDINNRVTKGKIIKAVTG